MSCKGNLPVSKSSITWHATTHRHTKKEPTTEHNGNRIGKNRAIGQHYLADRQFFTNPTPKFVI